MDLKQLFLKIKGSPLTPKVGIGLGGLAAGLGLAGVGSAISNMSNARQLEDSMGYVGHDMAAPYVLNNYGVNPSSPTDIAQLPPEQFKQLILDSRHGGMYNPMSGKMIF